MRSEYRLIPERESVNPRSARLPFDAGPGPRLEALDGRQGNRNGGGDLPESAQNHVWFSPVHPPKPVRHQLHHVEGEHRRVLREEIESPLVDRRELRV